MYNLDKERSIWPQLAGKSDEEAIIWLDNLFCCACEGCPDCEHDCHHSEEERSAKATHRKAVLDAMFTMNPGEVRQIADGTWLECIEDTNPAGNPCHTIREVDPDEEAYQYYLNPENRQAAGPGRARNPPPDPPLPL